MGNILPFAIAFAAGLLASFVDYLVSRATMHKDSAKYYATPLRTIIACVFVAALYIIGNALKIKLVPFLISGAVGATVGLIVFTILLMRANRKDEGGKGDEKNE